MLFHHIAHLGCPKGLYDNGTACVNCELGSYKMVVGNSMSLCLSCGGNATSTTTGATSSDECGMC